MSGQMPFNSFSIGESNHSSGILVRDNQWLFGPIQRDMIEVILTCVIYGLQVLNVWMEYGPWSKIAKRRTLNRVGATTRRAPPAHAKSNPLICPPILKLPEVHPAAQASKHTFFMDIVDIDDSKFPTYASRKLLEEKVKPPAGWPKPKLSWSLRSLHFNFDSAAKVLRWR